MHGGAQTTMRANRGRSAVWEIRRSEASTAAAVRSALAMGIPLVVLVLMSRPEEAAFAAFGSFTGLYASSLPYLARARVLAGVGVGFVAAVAVGSGLSFLVPDGHAAVWVSVLAAVAGLAKWGCDTAGLGSPGPWMLLFAFAASTQVPAGADDVATRTLLAAAGAGAALVVVLTGALTDRTGPERRAVAAATRASARVSAMGDRASTRDWHHAHTALVRAERFARGVTTPDGTRLRRAVARAEDELTDAVLDQLTRGRDPLASAPDRADERGRESRLIDAPTAIERLRARNARHAAALRALTAARAVVGVGVAGTLSVLLGLGHPYWAPVSAAAVLQSTHLLMTWHRGLQRALGTAGGLVLAAILLEMRPVPWAIAGLVVLMQVGIELLIVRNYALGVLFITPLAILLSELLRAGPAHTVLVDRVVGVAVGILVGVAAALVVVHRRAAESLRDAVDRCRAAASWAATAAPGDAVAATE
jgi:hypothetical protein